MKQQKANRAGDTVSVSRTSYNDLGDQIAVMSSSALSLSHDITPANFPGAPAT